MKHDDTTLQAAIDAAMLEIGRQTAGNNFAACKKSWPKIWLKESPDRLALAKAFLAKLPEAQPIIAAARGEAEQQPDSTDWKARAEKAESDAAVNYGMLLAAREHTKKAEAELAAIKSSPIGTLRPLSEAGPVPDGCVRVKGYKCTENDWCLAHWENRRNTHFADIRLPSKETPAPVNEQPKQQVPLGPEDVMPGSVIQGVSSPSWHWISVVSVHQIQVKLAGHCGDIGTDRPTWEELKLAAKINRSIPLTGKWDATAWEPCSKPGK